MAFAPDVKTGQAKLKDVTGLLLELRQDLDSPHLTNDRRIHVLERLKIYGRDPVDAGPIYSSDGVHTLTEQAFLPGTSITASREALSCIANALLLQEQTRTYLAVEQPWTSLVERLNSLDSIDQFLAARILFVMTYVDQGSLYHSIIQAKPLTDNINRVLAQHVSQPTKDGNATSPSPMDGQALTEIAKLIFNITNFLPTINVQFSASIPHLLALATERKYATPLQQPQSAILNALLHLDSTSTEWTTHCYDISTSSSTLASLISILDRALAHYKDKELDMTVSPLIALFSRLYAAAPEPAQLYLKEHLLPSEQDRNQVLGHSDSLASRLLRLSNSPSAEMLANAISQLLFELSDGDPDAFVQNVGLGYASGYLVSNGLPLPTQGGGADGDQGAASASGSAFNPITGQRIDQESVVDDLPPMTEEEKEREAERLFVLFERLKATGVMDVRNPVEDAHRFEELPD